MIMKRGHSILSPPVTPPGGQFDGAASPQPLPSPELSPSQPTLPKYITAKEFLRCVRRQQAGLLSDNNAQFRITVAEHDQALRSLEARRDRDLHGFFHDKFRYDYDSSTGLVRIWMPSVIHESFRVEVQEIINGYLNGLKSCENARIKSFADKVKASGSADIVRTVQKDAEYKLALKDNSSFSSSDGCVPPLPSLNDSRRRISARLSSRAIQEPNNMRSAAENTPLPTSPVTKSSGSDTLSVRSERSTLTKRWSPDDSWKHKDDFYPTVIVEAARSQTGESLASKARSLIEDCNAKVVLGFQLGDESGSKPASAVVTKWTAECDDEGAVKATSVSTDLLSNGNMGSGDGEGEIHLTLDDFASDESLNLLDERDFDAVISATPLAFDLPYLGKLLITLREEERISAERQDLMSLRTQSTARLTEDRAKRKRRRDTELHDRLGKRTKLAASATEDI